MSELTDRLRRDGLRPSIVSKIDWLIDDLETEVADVLREALLRDTDRPEWVEDEVTWHSGEVDSVIGDFKWLREEWIAVALQSEPEGLKAYDEVVADLAKLKWGGPEL